MDFDETWYAWSTQSPLQVLLFFGQMAQNTYRYLCVSMYQSVSKRAVSTLIVT